MVERISPFMLGATLYMPATRDDLAEIIFEAKIPSLRSLVICLEDAISEKHISYALANLQAILKPLSQKTEQTCRPLVFIRPRDSAMATNLVNNFNLTGIAGFVLPKFTLHQLPCWWNILNQTELLIMPTLETHDVFDANKMTALAESLAQHPCRERIIALRIGGNDLLSVLALRHSRQLTVYDGPLGYVIKMLVAIFASRGFSLTAPVCEQIDNIELLQKELALDVAHGLVGKTAIHPAQIIPIQQGLMVESQDYDDALNIINSEQAVFKSQGAMCEPATHYRWASTILERSVHCGIAGSPTSAAFARYR